MHVKNRMIIASGVLTVLTLGIGGAIGVPSLLTARADIRRIAAAQTTLDDRFAARMTVNKTMTDIAAAKRRVAPLSAMAVQEGHELDFVTAIESAAKDSSVDEKINLVTANQIILSPWERELPVSISIGGPFTNVLTFLNSLERMPYLIIVSGVQMSPLTVGAQSSGSVSCTISASVYWLGANAPDFVRGQIIMPPATAATTAAVKP
jgi:Tfp pilus assembly protein PilO